MIMGKHQTPAPTPDTRRGPRHVTAPYGLDAAIRERTVAPSGKIVARHVDGTICENVRECILSHDYTREPKHRAEHQHVYTTVATFEGIRQSIGECRCGHTRTLWRSYALGSLADGIE